MRPALTASKPPPKTTPTWTKSSATSTASCATTSNAPSYVLASEAPAGISRIIISTCSSRAWSVQICTCLSKNRRRDCRVLHAGGPAHFPSNEVWLSEKTVFGEVPRPARKKHPRLRTRQERLAARHREAPGPPGLPARLGLGHHGQRPPRRRPQRDGATPRILIQCCDAHGRVQRDDGTVIELLPTDQRIVSRSRHDWGEMEPARINTMFNDALERSSSN
mmetsp:Transcript_27964/g.85800  ORF Transcript_27964/g.85800 Transcript_27964/m.85800 type:complete len:221 (-) Transcript_27964:879-1541(-)